VVAVDDTALDARWPALGADGVRSVVALPLGVWGVLTFTADAPGAFDDATRAVAREIAGHGTGLLAGEGAGVTEAVRARQLVVTASTLLARRQDLDPSDGLDALLERAVTAGSSVLAAAEHVLDELGLPGDGGRPHAPEPATLRRALAHLEEHAAEDVDVADVARAAGLGVRGLQMTFRRWRGTTPLGHLREIRLARAHEELRASDPRDTTVADIATRWHFTHPGRFSVTYRERYGCSPSATLRA
jgi:AraC-like DNA-binding protein